LLKTTALVLLIFLRLREPPVPTLWKEKSNEKNLQNLAISNTQGTGSFQERASKEWVITKLII
jgi:hypothetical protein